ncbi:GH92 family glycosyl hydrolase [uncultured Alistipes sp.]|jgi:putative alpha-1,2-mannosidase|uniref:GH92 family glycosyl hydrolase n=1 Tax=uncultured Alistipes sp. TaxID=538949 RepID=UPI0025FE9660|nr:GH92 family glycosyl hydrolase [uncultured Alistipes sp.]
MLKTRLCIALLALAVGCAPTHKSLTEYVNPLLGTATLWDSVDLGFKPTKRTWGGETFPGASLPNAMVQVSPYTAYRSGSGYQYEDSLIYGFIHTSKGHWNLCHIPLMPVTGTPTPSDYASPYSHDRESAAPGYYRVFLDRYGVDVELSSTLRCAFHKYTFPEGAAPAMLANLQRSNEHVRSWDIRKTGDNTFAGWQQLGEKMYFYAVANRSVTGVESVVDELATHPNPTEVRIVRFGEGRGAVELQIGFSFVSEKNARENLEAEMLGKSFADVRAEATDTWNKLLGQIRVEGGTEREKGLFYSCLYHAMLWPTLRSDVNGEFTDVNGKVLNPGFRYYTEPAYWDDYRNKLILLDMLAPDVAADVISSEIDKGEKRGGFMPTFFHGDHAATFIAGSYLRGNRGYDIQRAYNLILRNATVQGPSRPWLDEYIARGWISEMDYKDPVTNTVCKAAVTKTLEYSYDDYAVALVAKALNDNANYEMLIRRTSNYKNMFDPSTGLMRGRLEDGSWITPFRDTYPYYEYMYREANAWQQTFFAPHDTEGLIGLYPSREAFGQQLDRLFSIPWEGYEVDNLSGFIGQYCHGNQPDHGFTYLYSFIGRQERTQELIDHILDRFYGMGPEQLALCGMNDAGEMTAWYVFNAMGLYTYSPADPEYIVTVPLFDKVSVSLGDGSHWTIRHEGKGRRITDITCAGKPIDGWFVSHDALDKGELVITTSEK